ncbi:MAG: sulfite exporter TauE/SafE family protein [Proteobacteria bacterium]|nr:sulfite exporter TauE/SafE family protein [Pseudomonadota bacterium]
MFNGLDSETLLLMAGLLAVAGGLTGILAGLFGVGGGTITVPILYYCFGLIGVPDTVAMPLAVGTSLAIIVPTSIKSARGHHARGAVDMALVKAWAIPIVLGVVMGAVVARYSSPWVFQLVFVGVATSNAIKLLWGSNSWRLGDKLPDGPLSLFYGWLVGICSALMGIGGGAISNLIFTLYNKPIHNAVATSAALGVLISIPGALGYVFAGLGKEGLPPASLGFVSFLAFALMVPTTLLTTGIGVRLAHRLSRRKLELAFGLYLAAVSLRFILRLLGIV